MNIVLVIFLSIFVSVAMVNISANEDKKNNKDDK